MTPPASTDSPTGPLAAFSNALADIVDAVGVSTVGVRGRHRHGVASGVVWRAGILVTAAHVFRRTPAAVSVVGGGGQAGEWLERGVTVLPRDAAPEQVGAAVVAAGAGLVASSPAMISQALRFARIGVGRRTEIGFEPLTPGEQQVLVKMVHGLGNREIADALHVSPHTAKFHVAQIISKLNANSRAHAVAKALQAGLLES